MTRARTCALASVVFGASVAAGGLLALRREAQRDARIAALDPDPVAGGDGVVWCGVDFGADHASVVWAMRDGDDFVIVDEVHYHSPGALDRLREQAFDRRHR